MLFLCLTPLSLFLPVSQFYDTRLLSLSLSLWGTSIGLWLFESEASKSHTVLWTYWKLSVYIHTTACVNCCLFNPRCWWSQRELKPCPDPVRITQCSPPSRSLPFQTPRRPRPRMCQRLVISTKQKWSWHLICDLRFLMSQLNWLFQLFLLTFR